ncbi:MAG: sulfite exporter TauE/SafE family protein [Candidatus Omnitrophica bacterium]|nr:sulfite exporter TauE/SafE family protein [Candidatus Omnitrophota bacterium]
MNYILYIILGLVAGTLSGIFGIGGGVILIPGLVVLAGLTQHQAQGTTLAAMIPPIGLLAAMRYYQAGNVKISMAIFICIGFFFGGLLGANIAHFASEPILKKLFGVFLFFISMTMIFGK